LKTGDDFSEVDASSTIQRGCTKSIHFKLLTWAHGARTVPTRGRVGGPYGLLVRHVSAAPKDLPFGNLFWLCILHRPFLRSASLETLTAAALTLTLVNQARPVNKKVLIVITRTCYFPKWEHRGFNLAARRQAHLEGISRIPLAPATTSA
jgi:hypothetical protein